MTLSHLRDRAALSALAFEIRKVPLPRPVRFMEVCGGHTAVIHRYGLQQLLPPDVTLVSGPGCPVCVTGRAFVDACIALAETRGIVLASFGDLIRVPGSRGSLADARARGADVRALYSPTAALDWAHANPDWTVVIAGIGFETTACTVAAALHEAVNSELRNLRLLCAMKTMPAALRALLSDSGTAIDGLILPGHVVTVTGIGPFRFLPLEFAMPCAVSGFEPADLLASVLALVRQVHHESPKIAIQYTRSVRPEGNPQAQLIMTRMFEPCDADWRGLGVVSGSGLRLRAEFAAWDAAALVPPLDSGAEPAACRCGEILRGRLSPFECPLFGTACTPEAPQGACMVSSEGACAAAFQFAAVNE